MSCSGIHCSGCAGGAVVPPVAFAALFGLPWVIEHAVEVAAVSAACGVLAVAAVVWLLRRGDRRDDRQRAAASIWTVRAEAVTGTRVPDPLSHPAVTFAAPGAPDVTADVTAAPRRLELEPRALHLHFYGQPTAEQAAVIRHAINGGPQ